MPQTLTFSADKPAAYVRLDRESEFSAAKHLALEKPVIAESLQDLEYSPKLQHNARPPSLPLFGFFSDEGLAGMQECARRMKSNRNQADGVGQNRLGSHIHATRFGFVRQGNMVFHRARRLLEKADRVTMIPSFVALDDSKPECSNIWALFRWGDPGMAVELARHEAWLAREKLRKLIDEISLAASCEDTAGGGLGGQPPALFKARRRAEAADRGAGRAAKPSRRRPLTA